MRLPAIRYVVLRVRLLWVRVAGANNTSKHQKHPRGCTGSGCGWCGRFACSRLSQSRANDSQKTARVGFTRERLRVNSYISRY
jgi:hypothetical protein